MMKSISQKMTLIMAAGWLLSGVAAAAEMDHSGHNMHGPAVAQTKSKKPGRLGKLSSMPPI